MKKYISLSFLFIFIFFTCHAFAASTAQLISYYPAPVASYNTVKLSSNYVSTNVAGCQYCNQAASCCTATNSYTATSTGLIYQCSWSNLADPPPSQLMECSGAGTSVQWCTAWFPSNSNDFGTIITDSTGTMHACLRNQFGQQTDSIYPQQCYNTSCSFTYPECSGLAGSTCPCVPSATNGVSSICAPGYSAVWLYSGPNRFTGGVVDIGGSDIFQSSSTNYTMSYACCPASMASSSCDETAIAGDYGAPTSPSTIANGQAFCWWWTSNVQSMCVPSGTWVADGTCP